MGDGGGVGGEGVKEGIYLPMEEALNSVTKSPRIRYKAFKYINISNFILFFSSGGRMSMIVFNSNVQAVESPLLSLSRLISVRVNLIVDGHSSQMMISRNTKKLNTQQSQKLSITILFFYYW